MTRLEFLRLIIYSLLAPLSKYAKFRVFTLTKSDFGFPFSFPIVFAQEKEQSYWHVFLPLLRK